MKKISFFFTYQEVYERDVLKKELINLKRKWRVSRERKSFIFLLSAAIDP